MFVLMNAVTEKWQAGFIISTIKNRYILPALWNCSGRWMICLKVSIIPRTNGALGFTQSLPKELAMYTECELQELLMEK